MGDEPESELIEEYKKQVIELCGHPGERLLSADELDTFDVVNESLQESKRYASFWETVVKAEASRVNDSLVFESPKDAAAVMICLYAVGLFDRPLYRIALEAFLCLASREIKERFWDMTPEFFFDSLPHGYETGFAADTLKKMLGVTGADVAECADEQADSCHAMAALSGTVH